MRGAWPTLPGGVCTSWSPPRPIPWLPPNAYVTLEHEYILILRKGPLRKRPGPGAADLRRRSAFFWEERNTWFSDVWDLRGTRQAMGGDAPWDRSGAFPFELAYRLIAMFSVQGDTVLDPFVGTGTTCLAAATLGRSGVGVDLYQEMVERARAQLEVSVERLNAWTLGPLERHRTFLREAETAGRTVGHINDHHGFGVVTAQERALALDLIRGIRLREPGVYDVTYTPVREEQLALFNTAGTEG